MTDAPANEPPGVAPARTLGLDPRVVATERPSSAEESAQLQGIDIGSLIRTIVVRRGEDDYLFVLVPGGRQIDWPALRKHLGVSRLSLPEKEEAKEVTGYERGTITPFGSTRAWPVIASPDIASLDPVAIGAGAHGVNLHLPGEALLDALAADRAEVTRPAEPHHH